MESGYSLSQSFIRPKYVNNRQKDIILYKRLKVPTFIYCHLQGNQNSSSLQFKVAYWPALVLGGVAQLATAQCPNERTLDPQSAARQTHLCPSQPPHYGHTIPW